MENIFEGAKFGDKFVTRDGRVAIYHACLREEHHCLFTHDEIITVYGDGLFMTNHTYDKDIVSRYIEPHGECNNNPDGCLSSVCPGTCSKFIGEDVLSDLAYEYEESLPESYTWNEYCNDDDGIHGVCSVCEIEKAFKAGYRKAKEE